MVTGLRHAAPRPVGGRAPEIIDGAAHPAEAAGAGDAQRDPAAAQTEPVEPVLRGVGHGQQIGGRWGEGAGVLNQLVAAQQIKGRGGIGLVQAQRGPVDG